MQHHRRLARALTVTLVGTTLGSGGLAGCAKIAEHTYERKVPISSLTHPMESRFEPLVNQRWIGRSPFDDGALELEVRRHETCRRQRVDTTDTIAVSKRTFDNPLVPLTTAAVGFGAGFCSGLHLAEIGCLQHTDEETGDSRPLEPDEHEIAAVVFGTIAVAAVALVVVDLFRVRDSAEVVERVELPFEPDERDCGIRPLRDGVVEIVPSGQAPIVRVRTNIKGVARVPANALGLTDQGLDGSPGEVVLDGEILARIDPMPHAWQEARLAHFEARAFEEASDAATASAYREYLLHFPHGPHAPQIHERLQTLLLAGDDLEALVDYVATYEDADEAAAGIDAVIERRDARLAEALFEAYVTQFEAEGSAHLPADVSSAAASLASQRIVAYHTGILRLHDRPEDLAAFAELRPHLDAIHTARDLITDDDAHGDTRAKVDALVAEFGDVEARAILHTIRNVEELSPPDPRLELLFERAFEVAHDQALRGELRHSYIDLYLASYRNAASTAASFDAALPLLRRAQARAVTPDELAKVRRALLSALSDEAERVALSESPARRGWTDLFDTAHDIVETSAERDLLAERWRRIERKLQKRFPMRDLTSARDALFAYPATVSPDDGQANHDALDAPRKHRHDRLITRLRIKQAVGEGYLAISPWSQTVFIEPANQATRRRLERGGQVDALVEIDGAMPYSRDAGKTHIPRLTAIWAD